MGAAEDARQQRINKVEREVLQNWRKEVSRARAHAPRLLSQAIANLKRHNYPSGFVGAPSSRMLTLSGESRVAWTLVEPGMDSERMGTVAHAGFYILGDGVIVRRENAITSACEEVYLDELDGFIVAAVRSLELIIAYRNPPKKGRQRRFL